MNVPPKLRRAFVVPTLAGLALAGALATSTGAASAPVAADDSDLVLVSTVPAPRTVHRPALHPVLMQLPVDHYELTARFGDVSGLWNTVHTGLDFAAPEGTPVHAIAEGTVVSTAYDGSYGNKTVIRLDDGTKLWFCHQSEFEVSPGDRVEPGQEIGRIGSTGNVTGPHLHLEVHPGGVAVDPEPWLRAHGMRP